MSKLYLQRKWRNPNISYIKSSITYDLLENKSAQSNLGRGPRRSTVAHVRRKVPIGYNGVLQIRP